MSATFNYVANFIGKEAEGKQVKAAYQIFLTGKGIDRKRTIGMYSARGADLDSASAVLVIPVDSEKALLAALDNVKVTAEKDDDGVMTLSSPQFPITAYMRVSKKYAFIAFGNKEVLAEKQLPDPEKVLGSEGPPAFLSFDYYLDRLSEKERDQVLEQIEAKLKEEEEKERPDENEAQHKARVMSSRMASRLIATLFHEGSRLSLTLDVNRKTNEITLESIFTAKPGTQMATSIAELPKVKSLLGSLVDGNAVTYLTRFNFSEEFGKAIFMSLYEGLKKDITEDKKAMHELAMKVIRAYGRVGRVGWRHDSAPPHQRREIYPCLGFKAGPGRGCREGPARRDQGPAGKGSRPCQARCLQDRRRSGSQVRH